MHYKLGELLIFYLFDLVFHLLYFEVFDYYCFSKFKNKEEIQLFNLAIAFYKQKLDVIYLFHIILLFEKFLGTNKSNIINDEDLVFHLNEFA